MVSTKLMSQFHLISKVTWSKPMRSLELWSRRYGRGPAWSCWTKLCPLQAVSGHYTNEYKKQTGFMRPSFVFQHCSQFKRYRHCGSVSRCAAFLPSVDLNSGRCSFVIYQELIMETSCVCMNNHNQHNANNSLDIAQHSFASVGAEKVTL